MPPAQGSLLISPVNKDNWGQSSLCRCDYENKGFAEWMLSRQDPTMWKRSSSCPYRKKLSQWVIHTFLGYFRMHSILEGEEPWRHKIPTELTVTIQKTSGPKPLQIGFFVGWNTLSWACLVVYQLYSYCAMLVAQSRYKVLLLTASSYIISVDAEDRVIVICLCCLDI